MLLADYTSEKPSTAPISGKFTLRFKQHTTTILLLVAQGEPFSEIKQDLLAAIEATGINDINGNPLPSDAGDIVFGVPVDRHDISKGWIALKIPEDDAGVAKGKSVKKGSVLNETPLGAGLRDGAVLAFKFREGGEEDPMDEEWDVIMPAYEDEL